MSTRRAHPVQPRSPEVHASWNSPALVDAVLQAWEQDRPIALLNPVLMDLPAVGDWIRELGPELGEGLPPGFQAILLTSGTTGQPRLVALGRDRILWNVETVARHLNLPVQGLETHLTLPLFHAFGLVLGLFLTHLNGGRLHLLAPGESILDPLWGLGADPDAHPLLLFVPTMVRTLPEPDALSPEVRARLARFGGTSITGGAPVRRADLHKLAGLLPRMSHTIGYGLTEAGPALTHTAGEIPEDDSALGAPLPGVRLMPPVFGTEEPSGWTFHSPGMASAVLAGESNRWQIIHKDDCLPTGDLLALASSGGGYVFRGRTAWTFKKKGETISPQWIEDALWARLAGLSELSGDGVSPELPPNGPPPDGLMIAPNRPDSHLEAEGLLLLVEGTYDPAWEARLDCAIATLPPFLRPDRVVWVPRFPRNVLGKVERGALS